MLDFDRHEDVLQSAQCSTRRPAGRPVTWSSFLPDQQGRRLRSSTQLRSRHGSFGVHLDPQEHRRAVVVRHRVARRRPRSTAQWLDSTASSICRRRRANNHAATLEPLLNYEPTVNPIASGGYAWVVFTSRRMYGNVATIDRWHERSAQLRLAHQTSPTKKLWVAAIDLNAPARHRPQPSGVLSAGAGAPRRQLARLLDASIPATPTATSCETGDECCGGYCEPGGDGGLICTSQTPPVLGGVREVHDRRRLLRRTPAHHLHQPHLHAGRSDFVTPPALIS